MRSRLGLLVLLLAAMTSCNSSVETVSIGASMTGTVKLFNTNTNSDDQDASGALVTLLGTDFHSTTGKDGKWTIGNAPPGIYTLVATKPGYDTAMLREHKFPGAGVDFIDPLTIHLMADANVVLDSVRYTGGDSAIKVFGRSLSAAASLTSILIGTSTTDTIGWRRVSQLHIEAGAPFVVMIPDLTIRRQSVLQNPLNGGSILIRASSQPEYGPTVLSNMLPLDIPSASIVLESITFLRSANDSGGYGFRDTIVVHGHMTPGLDLERVLLVGLSADSLRSIETYNTSAKDPHFTILMSTDQIRWILGIPVPNYRLPLHIFVAARARLEVQGMPDLESNKLETDLR